MSLFKKALEYHRKGLSIIPIKYRDKRPEVKWEPFQNAVATESQIRQWFLNNNQKNIATVLGVISNDLYSRDFDKKSSYEKWRIKNPNLVSSLPTVATDRGSHVYFRSDQRLKTINFEDGELRGEGSYILLPPSVHASGHIYNWTIPIPEQIPRVNPEAAGFLRDWSGTEQTEITDEDRGGIRESDLCALSTLSALCTLEEVIALSLPSNEHSNHKYLFKLARGIKSLEKLEASEFTQERLKEAFEKWYYRARQYLREEQSMDEYWFEFLEGYHRVLYPLGQDPMLKAWENAQLNQPAVASKFETREIRLLISFCRELQIEAGSNPFFLSCRVVQRLFSLESHTTAARWLKGLDRSKIISVVEKGGPETNRATRYRYIGN